MLVIRWAPVCRRAKTLFDETLPTSSYMLLHVQERENAPFLIKAQHVTGGLYFHGTALPTPEGSYELL